MVNFVDEKGEIIRIDARKLLDLKENQTVVIRGKAKLLGGAMLLIDADGIYTNPLAARENRLELVADSVGCRSALRRNGGRLRRTARGVAASR